MGCDNCSGTGKLLIAASLNSMIFSVMRTDEELSIVCESSIKLNSEQAETDWSALKAVSPLVHHPVIFLRCAMITLPEKTGFICQLDNCLS